MRLGRAHAASKSRPHMCEVGRELGAVRARLRRIQAARAWRGEADRQWARERRRRRRRSAIRVDG
eukprot:7677119-Pyramimonas_sp.AAC.1